MPVAATTIIPRARTTGALSGFSNIFDLLSRQPSASALVFGQSTSGSLGYAESGEDMGAGGVGLQRILERQLQCPIDHLPARDVLPVDERDRNSRRSGSTGATDSVQVGLLVIRALVVDDMRDAIDIDAAGGNIGGDENVDLAGAERAQRLFTRSLP